MATIIVKDNYKVSNLNEGITLSEAIDGISYNATVKLVETEELRSIQLVKGNGIEIWDDDHETKKSTRVFKGVVWETARNRKSKRLTLSCKERTVYIEESEDEYLLTEGQTATQRATQFCNDWRIPIGNFVNTNIALSKAVRRSDTIFSMMMKDLKETSQKGGSLYKYRMLDKLDLIEIGSNATVWKLETAAEEIEDKGSLQGVVTQVKVLGKQEDDKKTPVIGTYQKDVVGYGTIQKILQDENIKSVDDAKKRAESLFSTGEDSIRVSGVDINTIRAGDKVSLNGVFLYATDVTHNLGSTGKMDLNLGGLDYIRRKFYSGNI
jgi:hypothetical protein